MKQTLTFSSTGARQLVAGSAGAIEVDARYGKSRQRLDAGLLLVCHPHPLFGGSMDNKVVTTLARAAREMGLAQVRFNFRGVGQSQGAHADMHGEAADLQQLIELCRAQLEAGPLVLAGFSFGSGVSSLVVADNPDIAALHLVAPPVARYQGVYADTYPCPVWVYQGDSDEVIDAQATRSWAESLRSPCELQWFEHTGHFFHGRLTELHRDFSAALKRTPGHQR